MWQYFITGLLSLCASVQAFSSGAPGGQCDQMVPQHNAQPQSGSSPYNIVLSEEKYGCQNQEITVTVNGTSPFKGFLCQPRSDPNVYSTVGTITTSGSVSTKNNCGANAAITHTEQSDKNTLSFVWRPSNSTENVYIVCTIVQDKNTFWVKERSNVITYQSGGSCNGSGSGSASTHRPSLASLKNIISLFLGFYFIAKRI